MRLFTAVDLSGEVARQMEQLQQGCKTYLPCQRWQKIQNMHITLHFLGEVADANISSLQAILREEAREHTAFPLALKDWGAFPNESHPRVVWVGVQDQPALVKLQQSLAPKLQAFGYAEAAKGYAPHITIGRNPREKDFDVLRRHVPVPSLQWTVEALVLYQSIFGPNGIQYEALARYPLSIG